MELLTVEVPTYVELLWPALKAVEAIGGSATISEMVEKVAEQQGFTDEQLEVPHRGNVTAIEYRLAWARTHLKFVDALANSKRGVWTITDVGRNVEDDQTIRKMVVEARDEKRKLKQASQVNGAQAPDEDANDDVDWKDELLAVLKAMDPSAFERLCQRLLRESGFIEVEVLGKSGDGGIDGSGILKIGLLSFHVFFQCKRYKDAVSSPNIRDFRGASIGRGDKGLFITTGRFTVDARREATRDGAPPVDLIDGDELCELLQRLELGVTTEMVPERTIDHLFFKGF